MFLFFYELLSEEQLQSLGLDIEKDISSLLGGSQNISSSVGLEMCMFKTKFR